MWGRPDYHLAPPWRNSTSGQQRFSAPTMRFELHGGYGLHLTNTACRNGYRDAKILELYEGTKEAEILTHSAERCKHNHFCKRPSLPAGWTNKAFSDLNKAGGVINLALLIIFHSKEEFFSETPILPSFFRHQIPPSFWSGMELDQCSQKWSAAVFQRRRSGYSGYGTHGPRHKPERAIQEIRKLDQTNPSAVTPRC